MNGTLTDIESDPQSKSLGESIIELLGRSLVATLLCVGVYFSRKNILGLILTLAAIPATLRVFSSFYNVLGHLHRPFLDNEPPRKERTTPKPENKEEKKKLIENQFKNETPSGSLYIIKVTSPMPSPEAELLTGGWVPLLEKFANSSGICVFTDAKKAEKYIPAYKQVVANSGVPVNILTFGTEKMDKNNIPRLASLFNASTVLIDPSRDSIASFSVSRFFTVDEFRFADIQST